MIDIALSLCMCHQIYDYVCIFVGGGGWGGGGLWPALCPTPLGGLNMCTLNTNINVMHDLKVIHTLLATCSYIEPFNEDLRGPVWAVGYLHR